MIQSVGTGSKPFTEKEEDNRNDQPGNPL